MKPSRHSSIESGKNAEHLNCKKRAQKKSKPAKRTALKNAQDDHDGNEDGFNQMKRNELDTPDVEQRKEIGFRRFEFGGGRHESESEDDAGRAGAEHGDQSMRSLKGHNIEFT